MISYYIIRHGTMQYRPNGGRGAPATRRSRRSGHGRPSREARRATRILKKSRLRIRRIGGRCLGSRGCRLGGGGPMAPPSAPRGPIAQGATAAGAGQESKRESKRDSKRTDAQAPRTRQRTSSASTGSQGWPWP